MHFKLLVSFYCNDTFLIFLLYQCYVFEGKKKKDNENEIPLKIEF